MAIPRGTPCREVRRELVTFAPHLDNEEPGGFRADHAIDAQCRCRATSVGSMKLSIDWITLASR